jgi:hypothetical protein
MKKEHKNNMEILKNSNIKYWKWKNLILQIKIQ